MKLQPKERQAIITNLVTNCDAWRARGDKEILDGFSDEKLVSLQTSFEKARQATQVANVATAGFSDGQSAFRINPDTGKWERAVLNETSMPKGKGKGKAEEDDDVEEETTTRRKRPVKARGMSDEERDSENDRRMKNKSRSRNARTDNGDDQSHNSSGRNGSDDADGDQTQERPRRRLLSADDWLRSAPPEVQNTIRTARELEQREKDKIITEILGNVAEKERPVHRERLQRRTLDELRDDLLMFPRQPSREELSRVVEGASKTTRNVSLEDDMLTVPTINWQQLDTKPEAAREAATPAVPASDGSEEEWLRNAPASIRTVVQNAMAVDARERNRLIDELISNTDADEETERRLLHRFRTKSLEELRDLVALLPSKTLRQPLYSGAAGANLSVVDNSSSEDLLLLPSMNWSQLNDKDRRKEA